MTSIQWVFDRAKRIRRSTRFISGIGMILVIVGGVTLIWTPCNPEVVIGIVGLATAYCYFLLTNSLESARFQRELFTTFNVEYNRLNGGLIASLDAQNDKGIPTLQQKKCLDDYFNLCGEEYYYYRKGFVDEEVWGNWVRGMYWWYSQSEMLGVYWNEKLGENSYYGLNRKVIHEGARKSEPLVPWANL